jgi:hypothetical protein
MQLPSAVVFCVDTWPNKKADRTQYGKNLEWDRGEDNFREWSLNMKTFIRDGRAVPIRGESKEVASRWKRKIDLLFIDGDHTTRGVFEDLEAWYPKLRPGGLLVGHDWDGSWSAQVRAGVLSYFSRSEINVDRLYYSGRHLGECYWKVA